MKRFRQTLYIVAVASLLGFKASASDQSPNASEYSGFTLAQIRSFHRMLERDQNWFLSGGDFNRFVHLHFSETLPHSIIKRGPNVRILQEDLSGELAAFPVQSRFGELSLKDYVAKANVDGMIVLHRGKIVFEAYPRMYANDFHIAYSVSKVFVSTVIAILEDRGLLDAGEPIDNYFQRLKGSGLEGVPVRDVLSMSSGLATSGTVDPRTCVVWGDPLVMEYGWPPSDAAVEDIIGRWAERKSSRPSGTKYIYRDENTTLLTLLTEALTGESFYKLVEREVWGKMGAEHDALMAKASYGRDATLLAVSCTLRDLARFGLLFTPSGRTGGSPVISDEYLLNIQQRHNRKIMSRSHLTGEIVGHSYQWDNVTADGDFYKHGFSGQGLYISPARDLVIAFFGTADKGNENENILPSMARKLATSGMFDLEDSMSNSH